MTFSYGSQVGFSFKSLWGINWYEYDSYYSFYYDFNDGGTAKSSGLYSYSTFAAFTYLYTSATNDFYLASVTWNSATNAVL